MQICACARIYRWTKNLWKIRTGPPGRRAAGLLLAKPLKQLVQASKAQTEAFNNLREDILLNPDPNEEDKDVLTDGTTNLLDLTTATNQLLDASSGHRPKSLPNNWCPDEGTTTTS